jgi:hypothetical protein
MLILKRLFLKAAGNGGCGRVPNDYIEAGGPLST